MSHALYILRRQRNVLLAVILREALTRFSGGIRGIAREFFRIALTIVVLTVVRAFARMPYHHGMDILPFMATGVLNFWIMRTSLFAMLSYPRTTSSYSLFPHVTPLDVAIARAIVNIGFIMLIAVVTFCLLIAFGYSDPMEHPMGVIGILLLSGVFGAALGLTAAQIVLVFPMFRTILNLTFRVMMFIGGVFFVIPEIPYRIRPYALYNPMLHLSDMIRGAYFLSYESSQSDPTYVAIWVLSAILVGLIVERAGRVYQAA